MSKGSRQLAQVIRSAGLVGLRRLAQHYGTDTAGLFMRWFQEDPHRTLEVLARFTPREMQLDETLELGDSMAAFLERVEAKRRALTIDGIATREDEDAASG